MRRCWKTISVRRQSAWLMLLVLVIGCDLPGKPDPANRPALPGEVMEFEPLFSSHCAGCHGADGEYGPAPPLNDPLFVKIIPDETLRTVIRQGRSGTPMPPFLEDHGGALNDKQIDVVVAGIRSRWGTEESATDSPPAYELMQPATGELSADQLQRCEELFARVCADCHGADGAGGTAGGAINVPAFLELISDQAIRRILITGRSDLGMPDFASSDGRPDDFQPLTSAEVDDLVRLIGHWRQAGRGENDHDTSVTSLETR